jgi:hypothetical protein
MQPVAVMPLHDPGGMVLPHIKQITPELKYIFGQVFMRVTAATREAQPVWVDWLEAESFFQVTHHQPEVPVGKQFRALYAEAADNCAPGQILHLCFVDRVAFALQSEYRTQFMADVEAVTEADVPLLFQRSERAWRTHPSNYRAMEQIVTQVGELLLGRSLDLTWCHLVVQAGQLAQVLPRVSRPDLSMLAEILLGLGERVSTRDVDWLAWEDPFISGREADGLRREREGSVWETRKRLSYVIPTLQVLAESVEALLIDPRPPAGGEGVGGRSVGR